MNPSPDAGTGAGAGADAVNYSFTDPRFIDSVYPNLGSGVISVDGNIITITWNTFYSIPFKTLDQLGGVTLEDMNSNFTTTDTNITGFTHISSVDNLVIDTDTNYPEKSQISPQYKVNLSSAVASYDSNNGDTILTLTTSGDISSINFNANIYIGFHT